MKKRGLKGGVGVAPASASTPTESFKRLHNKFSVEKLVCSVGDTVTSIALSASGDLIAAGCSGSTVAKVFSVGTGQLILSCSTKGAINAMLFLQDEDQTGTATLVTGTASGAIQVFPIAASQIQSQVSGVKAPVVTLPFRPGDSVLCMAASNDGRHIVVGGRMGVVVKYQYDDDGGVPQAHPTMTMSVFSTQSRPVQSLAVDARAELMVVTDGESKTVQLWAMAEPPGIRPALTQVSVKHGAGGTSLPTGQRIDNFACKATVHSVALNGEGTILAVGVTAHTEVYRLSWWADSSGKNPAVRHEPLLYLEEAPALQGGVALSGSGDTLAVAAKGEVQIFHVPSGATIRRLRQEGRARCVALSNDGAVAIYGGFDKRVNLTRVHHGTRALRCANKSSSKSTVRSIHTVVASSKVAVGIDEGAAGGLVCLYESHEPTGLDDAQLVHSWRHPKPVWCVRFTHDGDIVLAACCDGVVAFYDVVSKVRLFDIVLDQVSAQQPVGLHPSLSAVKTSSFVWSMALSDDSRTLVVGSSSAGFAGRAHVYSLSYDRIRWRLAVERLRAISGQAPLAKATLAPPTGTVIMSSVIERGDRVYAVALDASGAHAAVAGRDKHVSLYHLVHTSAGHKGGLEDGGSSHERNSASSLKSRSTLNSVAEFGSIVSGGTQPWSSVGESRNAKSERTRERNGPRGQAISLWTSHSDDFIHAVALSANTKYCVHGSDVEVCVLDGRSGLRLWSVPCAGTVWSLSILDDPESALDAAKMVIGGDFHDVRVIDLATRKCEIHLLQDAVVHSVAITRDAVCFTSGNKAMIYGQGRRHFSWQDQPSFSHVTRTMALLSADEHRLPFFTVLLDQHPTVANTVHHSTGESLMQEVITRGWADYNPHVLKRMLNAQCRIGLQPDSMHGVTAVSYAVALGKLQPLTALLKAIGNGTINPTPACMSLISRSFRRLATKFPAEFLSFLKELPLEDEPEVFDAASTMHDVHLPRMLARGSEHRCPKGIWKVSVGRRPAGLFGIAIYQGWGWS